MNTTATPITITAGDYTAQVALRGAQLLRLTNSDPASGQAQNLVVPAVQADGAFPGAVLAPWPNRIAKSSYVHEGVEFQLPVSEKETGAALHGLIQDMEFAVQFQRTAEVHLSGVLEPTDGYPFRLEIVVVYRVASHLGLTTSVMVRWAPADDEEASRAAAAPFGVGFHPYLTAGDAPLKTCRLKLPARTVAKTKPDGRVVDRKPVEGDLDLTDGPLLAGLRIDHAYTDLVDDGWMAELVHGPSGLRVRLIADTRWAQVYTGDRIDRAGVAVEPMTCPPNAFNTDEDVVHLEPNRWFRTGYSVEALRG